MQTMRIGDRLVGPDQPPFVIAEAGVNHDGDLERALALVDAAAETGADAVKFQTFRTGLLVAPGAPKAAYQAERDPRDASQAAMLARLELAPSAFARLQARCRERGIVFLSTPFDEDSLALLHGLGVPAIKVASGELTNHLLLEAVAATRRPVLLSTGMSTLVEVRAAVEHLRRGGASEVIVLHCVSNYPADPADANLRALATLRDDLQLPVGYSDHTPGLEVALAAVALGACVLEKHFTLDRGLPGPDQAASLEPAEMRALVRGARTVWTALGDGTKAPRPSERPIAAVVRRSLFAARDLPAGTALERSAVAALRPGTGIPPAELPALLGRRLLRDVPAGTLLRRDLFA